MTTTSAKTPRSQPRGGRARAAIAAKTLRTDRWWFAPLITVVGLSAWVIYATVRVFMHKWYWVEQYHYLTPFYSPCVTDRCVEGSSHFGQFLPGWWIIPDAALTLPFLLLFRLTCYYYRKAYYRSFWLSPPACAVPDGHQSYSGETRFPLLGQNLHRYFFYAAAIISLINTWDAVLAFHSPEGFGFGLGNIILVGNVVMLWAYTISCHSCRHIIGGRLKHFSKHPMRYKAWTGVSWLNVRHMQLAWITLGTLALTDFYVMAVAAGWINDLRFIN
ncbi:hypothetical protein ACIODS_28590 [Micromonospora chalcea]|uniref:hypothetical protein n=1 Tax=Micromonospora chalcea TaxID=1874 RepID=UPI0004C34800|nr:MULTISPECIES: hypothetical protein [Micromonospora]MCT2277121.1 hypothetical protein [Micromonospora chalcea]